MSQRQIKLAVITGGLLLSAALLVNIWIKSERTTPAGPAIHVEAATVDSLAQSIRDAVTVEKLSVQQVEGIVIIQGKTGERNSVEKISRLAKDQGFDRVANLIQVSKRTDDEAIEREIERALGQNQGLDGCRFSIKANQGVITVSGVVQHELQKDLARNLARRVPGVKEVRADLRRL